MSMEQIEAIRKEKHAIVNRIVSGDFTDEAELKALIIENLALSNQMIDLSNEVYEV